MARFLRDVFVCTFAIFLTTLGLAAIAAETVDFRANPKAPSQVLEFKINQFENAKDLEIEVIGTQTNKVQVPCCLVKLQLNPGWYRMHARRLPYGKWGAWSDFVVHLDPLEGLSPRAGEKIKPMAEDVEKITFEWPVVSGALYYYFELRNAKGIVIHQERLTATSIKWPLPIATKYQWTVQPAVYENEEAETARQYLNFEIFKPAAEGWIVKVALHPDSQAVKYEFEITSRLGENLKSEPTLYQSASPNFDLQLPPSAYEGRGRAVYADGSRGGWGPSRTFHVPFPAAELETPKDNEEVAPDFPHKAHVTVKWRSLEGAERYLVSLFDGTSGLLLEKQEVFKNEATFRLPPNTAYGIYVKPYGYGEEETPLDKGEAASRFKIGTYFDDGFESPAEEPAHLYAWGSYISSNVNYLSKNTDNNSLTTDQIPGGSLEGAIGYWGRHSGYGALAFADMSGFIMEGQHYYYPTVGLLGGKRFQLSENTRMRLWAGVGHKEIPELVTEPGTSYLRVQDVGSYGAEIRATLIGPIYEKFDWYLQGYYYQSFTSGQTPNGLPLNEMQSYQVGAYISHPLGASFRGRLGYAYRADSSNYRSVVEGSNNLVQINGNYISLILEFALQAPEDSDD